MSTYDSELELVLLAKHAELSGGLRVRRAIPQLRRRTVGPFVFIDQMGPTALGSTEEITVLPHPHIGLSTLTYLFEGEGLHRDSLGVVQRLRPGEVNWMTAGSGIVHSERFYAGPAGSVFGVQIWVALPRDLEESPPSFKHYGVAAVPVLEHDGVTTRLIAGSLLGVRSEVETMSPLFYAEAQLESGSLLRLPAEYDERAAFVLQGALQLTETKLQAGEIAFFQRGKEILFRAQEPTRVLLLGGQPLDGRRYMSWNFVSSSKQRLARATEDWRQQRFAPIPGETSHIPLPDDGNEPVDYP